MIQVQVLQLLNPPVTDSGWMLINAFNHDFSLKDWLNLCEELNMISKLITNNIYIDGKVNFEGILNHITHDDCDFIFSQQETFDKLHKILKINNLVSHSTFIEFKELSLELLNNSNQQRRIELIKTLSEIKS
jgi:hypothetical protein